MTNRRIVPAALLAHDDHDHDPNSELDRGLTYDVNTLLRRRGALGLLGGAALTALAGCATTATSGGGASATGSSSTSATASATGSATAAASSAASASAVDSVVPDETAGPYPGDGSNGRNVLDDSGVVRSDITTSIGSSEKVAGVPMTINLTVTDSASGYAAMAGAAVYVWHCDAAGNYSMYSQGATDQTWLRGVTETNANGTATFTSVFPGCYAGRWPHIHFEVYKSTSDATSSGQIVKTSQIALPQAICETVYQNTSTYPNSTRNLGQLSLKTDNVFGNDGGIHQLATVTGDASSGYVVNLTIGV